MKIAQISQFLGLTDNYAHEIANLLRIISSQAQALTEGLSTLDSAGSRGISVKFLSSNLKLAKEWDANCKKLDALLLNHSEFVDENTRDTFAQFIIPLRTALCKQKWLQSKFTFTGLFARAEPSAKWTAFRKSCAFLIEAASYPDTLFEQNKTTISAQLRVWRGLQIELNYFLDVNPNALADPEKQQLAMLCRRINFFYNETKKMMPQIQLQGFDKRSQKIA